jgi:hypothetical protein
MSMHESPIAQAPFPRCGKVLPIGAVLARVLRRYELVKPADHGTPVAGVGVCAPVPVGVPPLVATTPVES